MKKLFIIFLLFYGFDSSAQSLTGTKVISRTTDLDITPVPNSGVFGYDKDSALWKIIEGGTKYNFRKYIAKFGGGSSLTLTTTGASGAATYVGGTLNIPHYTIDGLLPTQTSNAGKLLKTDGSNGSGIGLNAGHLFVGNVSNIPTDVAVSGDASLSSAGALTVTGLRGVALPSLSTGKLQYSGGSWSMDNTTYLTSNQTISFAPTGDVTGSTTGTTSLTPALTIGAGKVTNSMLAGSISDANILSASTWNAKMSTVTTTLGDIIYEDATPAPNRLSGNISTTRKFLSQTGNGSISAAPVWNALVSGDIPNNAANTTGSAATLTTSRSINNVGFNGSASIYTNLLTTGIKTSDYTAVENDLVICDGTSPFNVTLPTGLTTGARIGVKIVTPVNPSTITVLLSGSDVINLSGGSTSTTLNRQGYSKNFQYTAGSPGIWTITETDEAVGTKIIADLSTPSTSGSTITLDCNNQFERRFVGSASFATAKTMAINNSTNAYVFDFTFTNTNVAATLTLPSGWLMSDVNFSSHIWTPPSTGTYEMSALYNGTNWFVKIAGPFN